MSQLLTIPFLLFPSTWGNAGWKSAGWRTASVMNSPRCWPDWPMFAKIDWHSAEFADLLLQRVEWFGIRHWRDTLAPAGTYRHLDHVPFSFLEYCPCVRWWTCCCARFVVASKVTRYFDHIALSWPLKMKPTINSKFDMATRVIEPERQLESYWNHPFDQNHGNGHCCVLADANEIEQQLRKAEYDAFAEKWQGF